MAVRFIKLDDTGAQLDVSASEWVAVLDTTTDPIWSAEDVSTKRLTWKQAKAAVAKFELLGAHDWQLPTRVQLLSLVDDTCADPAIDVAFFPSCKPNFYWSSTPAAFSPAVCAWFVYFYDGSAYYFDQDDNYFVRAVRPRQSIGPLAPAEGSL
jgi:hypothetical protein